MRRIAITVLCLSASALALLSLAAGSAWAKEKPKLALTTPEGLIVGGAEDEAFSSNVDLMTSAGAIECPNSQLTGSFASNDQTKADKGSFSEGGFAGEEESEGCNTPLGPAQVTASGFPWSFELTTKSKVTLRGTEAVEITAVFPGDGELECTFAGKKVSGTFTLTSSEELPLELTFSNQRLKTTKGSNAACPKEVKLSGTFAVSSEGENVCVIDGDFCIERPWIAVDKKAGSATNQGGRDRCVFEKQGDT